MPSFLSWQDLFALCRGFANPRTAKLLFTTLFTVWVGLAAAEENTEKPRKRLNVNLHFYEDPALSSLGEVLAITQDKQGFMWFGGKNGLARFNGYSAQLFQHNSADISSLSTNAVNDLAVDEQGNLWIATYWGLNRYDPALERFERFMFDPENSRSLSHNSVLRLKISRSGDLWVGTEGGLLRFNPDTKDFDRFLFDRHNAFSLSGNAVSAIEEDQDGNLWVGVQGGGIDIFDPNAQRVIKRLHYDKNDTESLSQNDATSIEKTSAGNMWVGTYYGLNRYLGAGKFERYLADFHDRHSLGSSNVKHIMADGENIWLGTGDKGLMLYRPETNDFDQYFAGNYGESTTVSALFSDDSGGFGLGFPLAELHVLTGMRLRFIPIKMSTKIPIV